jgi:hypothetical protein
MIPAAIPPINTIRDKNKENQFKDLMMALE